MRQGDRTQLINKIKRVAEEVGSESVPCHEFLRRSGVSERKIAKLFGSYNGLVEAAGLTPLSFGQTYTDEYILEEVALGSKASRSAANAYLLRQTIEYFNVSMRTSFRWLDQHS